MTAPTRRRVTATGRLVLPADAPRDEWLDARKQGIGSSDVPRILGLYPSPLRVWYDKRGELPELDAEARTSIQLRAGHHWETFVAAEWTMRNRAVTRKMGLVENADAPWLRATVDRRVVECPEGGRNRCLLECKKTNYFMTSRWKRAIPDPVFAQVAHQLRVTGDDHAHVAVIVGDYDFRQYTVRPEGEAGPFAEVAAGVDAFYTDHMAAGVAPPAMDEEGEYDGDLYDLLHPERDGIVRLDIEQSLTALELIQDYRKASQVRGVHERARKNARAGLLSLLGDGEIAVGTNGDKLFSFDEVNAAPHVDLERLQERHRDAFEDCVTAKTSRKIKFGKGD
jgi:putative phage-type endonuclease